MVSHKMHVERWSILGRGDGLRSYLKFDIRRLVSLVKLHFSPRPEHSWQSVDSVASHCKI